MTKELLAKTLKDKRQATNHTQQQIADKLGIARASYTQIETSNRHISLLEAIELAKIYHCTLEELIRPF